VKIVVWDFLPIFKIWKQDRNQPFVFVKIGGKILKVLQPSKLPEIVISILGNGNGFIQHSIDGGLSHQVIDIDKLRWKIFS
jgi:hypothetical protein